MLETRSQKLGQGQRTVYEQARTLEVQNIVMDDRRADPQRVKRTFPTAGQTRAGRNEGPGRGLGQDEVQDKQQSHERHESCGQHGHQEPSRHDREGHLNLLREQRRSDREREAVLRT